MFKKIVLAIATTTMVISPLAAAEAQARPNDRTVVRHVEHDRFGNRVVTKQVIRDNDRFGRNGFNDRRWGKGQRFDRRYARNYRVINNPRAYRLNAAPRGYQWVQSGNDAVLVALAGGLIGAVMMGAIR